MDNQRSRQFLTLLLVFGAVVAGMVLAAGVNVTPPTEARPAAQAAASPTLELPAGGFQFPNFADLAESVSPAVVSIEATTFERGRGRGRPVDPFEFFFGPRRRGEPEDEEQEFRSDSGGSGFVISADGLVVTNDHVIREADELRIHLGDRTYEAEVKGTDPATDLALLQIQGEVPDLDYLALGDSDGLRVGEWVMAVGSPLGLEDTVTVGVVSAKRRQIGISADPSFEDFIQTDAAINFGNSGGPLINLAGEVVGINTAINWGSENIGFAVPVNSLKAILPQLRESGRVSRGFLGIGVQELGREAAEAFGLEEAQGVLVTDVQDALPAAEAGLRHGDVIVSADGRPVRDVRSLIDYVSSRPPGSEVVLELIRGGEREKRTVTLAERPTDGQAAVPEPDTDDERSIEWLGLRYQDLTPGLRQMHGLPDDLAGVWITSISPRSPFLQEGVRTGPVINVITEVNGVAISGVEVFERVVREAPAGSRLRVYIRRFANGEETSPVFAFPAVPQDR